MKSLVVYSSKTGNTRKLAQTVGQALAEETLVCAVDKAPDPSAYDFVAMGFWLKGGKPDSKSSEYLERLKGHKKIFLFATHGANPDSEYSRNAMNIARTLTGGARVAGTFCCYGEVNPNVLEKARAKSPPPVWLADAANAVGHPDAADLENLRSALLAALK